MDILHLKLYQNIQVHIVDDGALGSEKHNPIVFNDSAVPKGFVFGEVGCSLLRQSFIVELYKLVRGLVRFNCDEDHKCPNLMQNLLASLVQDDSCSVEVGLG